MTDKRWFVTNSDRRSTEGAPPWQSRLVSLRGPDVTASVEWYVLGKHGFGWGFQFGRNGSESDLGLDFYAGRVGSTWLRLRSPWTRWLRVTKDQDPKGWYHPRHTGLRIHPYERCYLSGEWDAYDGHHSQDDPWWRSWSINRTTILGRVRSETVDGDTGTTRVPLPEGVYEATWTERVTDRRYVRWPGTWRDRVFGPRIHRFIDVRVAGGIPVEGKGESDYDCGMDGVFATSGATVADAVANLVRAVLSGRARYGGPHHLPHPMTVTEASTAP